MTTLHPPSILPPPTLPLTGSLLPQSWLPSGAGPSFSPPHPTLSPPPQQPWLPSSSPLSASPSLHLSVPSKRGRGVPEPVSSPSLPLSCVSCPSPGPGGGQGRAGPHGWGLRARPPPSSPAATTSTSLPSSTRCLVPAPSSSSRPSPPPAAWRLRPTPVSLSGHPAVRPSGCPAAPTPTPGLPGGRSAAPRLHHLRARLPAAKPGPGEPRGRCRCQQGLWEEGWGLGGEGVRLGNMCVCTHAYVCAGVCREPGRRGLWENWGQRGGILFLRGTQHRRLPLAFGGDPELAEFPFTGAWARDRGHVCSLSP